MTEATTRLHITPLTSDLLPSVLPPSIRPLATDISFHTIPTFPENSYGYITLPIMEAEKIKKKLHGSILKGKKFKIEAARPHKRQGSQDVEPDTITDGKKSKKRKSVDGTLDGYEMPADRKVKRGWTEPANARKERRKSEKQSKGDKNDKPQPKSKYTEKPECLFRTTIPPNRASESVSDDKKAKKRKKSSESVVHEFAKTFTHPSFLRSTGETAAQTATFEEGKGWVDPAGNLKEPAAEKTRKKDYRPGQVPGAKEKRPNGHKSQPKETKEDPESLSESEDWTSSSGSSDASSDSESEASDSSESSTSSAKEKASAVQTPAEAIAKNVNATTNAPDGSEPEAASEPQQGADGQPSKEVHPLEALFKRAAPAASEDQPIPEPNAGFSFFGNNDDLESEDEPQVAGPQTPFTPFTKKDLHDRGLRSAAPTPDTSISARHMKWTETDDMDDDELSIDTPVSKYRGEEDATEKKETDFAKWFWENRGDNNRAWKKRRRDAAKEQRQRENRRKGIKGKS
ncbi:uncharacterized protein N7459_006778 [Penicillium hispanicum]|uniref:uncharacterized protein n=1 Tax=Penicillium hispanicum TaxID=1080232 RepID=UPI0025424836|nr:uncharacterized protein N7459_006778 [Penicillium hispanicum]KAJ5577814.1 hypothetical protein N7459_006778 [Penicillium hispanicum]